MNKKAFIFDLDGVIVNTANYHFLAWKKLANSIGIDFSKEQNEELKGVSRNDSLKKILDWGNKVVSDEEFKKLITEKNEDYLNYIHSMGKDEVLPGVFEVLNYLLEKDYKIALGSASKNSKEILNIIDLMDVFSVVVDGNDISKGKPDPEVFLKAAHLLQTSPECCIVFEDAVSGIQAANSANMTTIGIGEKDILNEANYVFKNIAEIGVSFIKEVGTVVA